MSVRTILVVLAIVGTGAAPKAHAGFFQDVKDLEWEDGRWRLELSGLTGMRSGGTSRTGDIGINGTVEKEFPLYEKLTVGLRFHPLFFYDEDDSDGETIWGTGAGVTVRYYFDTPDSGWFVEAMESGIVHTDNFRKNSTNFNFQIELGAGYKFENHWHVSGKWRHLSNAGFGSHNSGVNGVGLGVGFTF